MGIEGTLKENLEQVRGRMGTACERVGRRPEDVRLVVVTKTVGPPVIRALQALGVVDIGENRVQEAREKQDALGGTLGLRWHLVGHLQRNKVRHALRLFERVHSVDSVRLAEEISRVAGGEGRVIPVLLEANVSGEASKFGFAPGELPAALDAMRSLPHLSIEGLMTMAPFVEDAEQTRPVFAGLRELRDRLRAASGLPLPHLSMGMTQDFEVAIEEGATMVRIGTALLRGL
jgi:hypothetical protein